uniref:Uncharacterized protein n=1 Tax=Brassica oleracea TaxID=3712 RepID=A0A3P6CYC4_BRAOL|nr:unnamed protein product [Brassica oleracea]
MASSSSGKRASRRTRSNYSSSLRRDTTEEKDEKIVPNLVIIFSQSPLLICVWTLLEDNENNERPNELKYLSTMLVVAARTKFEEMDLLAYGFGGCNHFEPRNSVHYLLGHFQGLGSHEPQLQQLQGGAWDDEYENDDDDYAEKWRRRGNDGNGSATGSFGSGSERSKFCKRV